jgi:cellulose 1,4-beta-cellobiosidase
MGNTDFYGPGMTIDTTKKFTVVTQFIGSGSTLSEIKRFWVQNGKTIATPETTFPEIGGNSISDSWCEKQKTHFGDQNQYKAKGGLNAMGASLARGHVLVMSLWDDHAVNMPLRPVLPVVPAPPTLASPRMLRPTLPTPRSPSPTSSSVPLDLPSRLFRWRLKKWLERDRISWRAVRSRTRAL